MAFILVNFWPSFDVKYIHQNQIKLILHNIKSLISVYIWYSWLDQTSQATPPTYQGEASLPIVDRCRVITVSLGVLDFNTREASLITDHKIKMRNNRADRVHCQQGGLAAGPGHLALLPLHRGRVLQQPGLQVSPDGDQIITIQPEIPSFVE